MDIWDVRRTIERRTAALAAVSRTSEQADHLSWLAEQIETCRNGTASLTIHDIAFHMAIADASHNNLFKPIVQSFRPLMEFVVPTAWTALATEDQSTAMCNRHRAIAVAIVSGDPERAASAMDEHFDDSIRILCGISLTAPGAGNGP